MTEHGAEGARLQNDRERPRKNTRILAVCVVFVVGMVGAAYAAVPLYTLFCQVTGFGGTTQRAESALTTVSDATVQVRFDANVGAGLPWAFQAARPVTVNLGGLQTVYYDVTNLSDQTTAGTAAFNVTPPQTGAYFSKIACFCFTEQVLAPGETREMGVTFYVDPAMLDDHNTAGVGTITLSYTFFPAEVPEDRVAAAAPVGPPSGAGEI